MMRFYDLDHAATTQIHPKVLAAMMPYLTESYGNPSSMHTLGMQNKKDINTAKKHIALLLNCDFNELIFTGSGTEATNLAIEGYARKHPHKTEIITTPIEHAATLNTIRYLETLGYKVHYLEVDAMGYVSLADLKSKLNQNTLLVSIIWGNNELGTIQPIEMMTEIIHQHGACFHVDAVQMLAHKPMDLSVLNVDMMSFSGHKIHGPKGIGLLYKKKEIEIEPLIHGGGHEFHYRSGTENIAGIIGFDQALTLLNNQYDNKAKHLTALASAFYHQISAVLPIHLNGPTLNQSRIPGLLSLSFEGISGLKLQFKLNQKQIYVSTGSACHSNEVGVSHVIEAIHAKSPNGVIRISFGTETTVEDIPYLVDAFQMAYDDLKND
jgi:cysteine desulfurase